MDMGCKPVAMECLGPTKAILGDVWVEGAIWTQELNILLAQASFNFT
jgi:hypothetical protein